ncbi:uncharacterized protein BDR25DRAFT_358882, partial [Lindgomyces ingoldianus]
TVKLLLSHKDIEVNCSNIWGETPIHEAAIQGNLKVVKALLSHKDIDTNIRTGNYHWDSLSSNKTALWLARRRGHIDISNLLLAHGAVDDVDEEQDSIPTLDLNGVPEATVADPLAQGDIGDFSSDMEVQDRLWIAEFIVDERNVVSMY